VNCVSSLGWAEIEEAMLVQYGSVCPFLGLDLQDRRRCRKANVPWRFLPRVAALPPAASRQLGPRGGDADETDLVGRGT
jgi:hypothetical protein